MYVACYKRVAVGIHVHRVSHDDPTKTFVLFDIWLSLILLNYDKLWFRFDCILIFFQSIDFTNIVFEKRFDELYDRVVNFASLFEIEHFSNKSTLCSNGR